MLVFKEPTGWPLLAYIYRGQQQRLQVIADEIIKVEGFVHSEVCNFLFKGVIVDSGNTIVTVPVGVCYKLFAPTLLHVIFHMCKPLVECLTHLRSWNPTPILNPSDFRSGVRDLQYQDHQNQPFAKQQLCQADLTANELRSSIRRELQTGIVSS